MHQNSKSHYSYSFNGFNLIDSKFQKNDFNFIPLNEYQCEKVDEIVQCRDVVLLAQEWWFGRNLSGDVLILRGQNGEDRIYKKDSYMDKLLNKVLLRFMKKHFLWWVTRGVIPWYKKRDEKSGEFIPMVPDIEDGVIFVGFDKVKKEKHFKWMWYDNDNKCNDFSEKECDKDMQFLVIYGKEPSRFGKLKSSVSTMIDDFEFIKDLQKKAKQIEEKKVNPSRVIEQTLPKDELQLKYWKTIFGMDMKLASNRNIRNMYKKNSPTMHLLGMGENPYSSKNRSGSDKQFTFPNGRDQTLPKRNEKGEVFKFRNGAGMYLRPSGDASEMFLAPYQTHKQLTVQKERGDLNDMWAIFDEKLGRLLHYPASIVSGRIKTTQSGVLLQTIQAITLLGLNQRIKVLEDHVASVVWFCIGETLQEYNEQLIKQYKDRMIEVKIDIAKNREKLLDDYYKLKDEKYNPKKRKRNEIDIKEEMKKIDLKVNKFQRLQFKKYEKFADSFTNIRVKIPPKPFVLVADFNLLNQFFMQGLIDPKIYSELMTGLLGVPIKKVALNQLSNNQDSQPKNKKRKLDNKNDVKEKPMKTNELPSAIKGQEKK